MSENGENSLLAAERRERLGRPAASSGATGVNQGYSVFIRRLKLILPMVALGITAVVFTWGSLREETLVPAAIEASLPKTIGRNELLNPRFESTDDKRQPYTITAARAVQGETNDDLVILEMPVADMRLNNGHWIAIQAKQGAFRQDSQRLLLRGDVQMFHDRGYNLQTAQLQIDMASNTAWSEDDVYGQGPAGTLEAKGLRASSGEGHLVFSGPAKLILKRSVQTQAEVSAP